MSIGIGISPPHFSLIFQNAAYCIKLNRLTNAEAFYQAINVIDGETLSVAGTTLEDIITNKKRELTLSPHSFHFLFTFVDHIKRLIKQIAI